MVSWHGVLFVMTTVVALFMFAHTESGRASALSIRPRRPPVVEAPNQTTLISSDTVASSCTCQPCSEAPAKK